MRKGTVPLIPKKRNQKRVLLISFFSCIIPDGITCEE